MNSAIRRFGVTLSAPRRDDASSRDPRTDPYPMPTIRTFLTFDHQAEAAARFYTSVFPNSTITRIARYPDLGTPTPFKPGSVMTVDFTL